MWVDALLLVGMIGCSLGSCEAGFRERHGRAVGLLALAILLGVGLLVHVRGV